MGNNEVFWAGLAASVAMLGSGFSLLLFPTYIGYGAVILSMGVMTMILVMMAKALIIQIQRWMDYNARIEETVSTIVALRTQGAQIDSEDTAMPRKKKVKEKVEEEDLVTA